MTILSIVPLLVLILGMLVISKLNVLFSKRTNMVVMVYVFILLTATFVYGLLPMEKQAETKKKEREFWQEIEAFEETFHTGTLEQLKKNYAYEEWTLTTNAKKLNLEQAENMLTKIMNEQTDNNEMKVYLFYTDMMYNGEIVSDELGNYTAEIYEDYLQVYPNMHETIKSYALVEEFPIQQFSGNKKTIEYEIDITRSIGLYIVAPPSLEINE